MYILWVEKIFKCRKKHLRQYLHRGEYSSGEKIMIRILKDINILQLKNIRTMDLHRGLVIKYVKMDMHRCIYKIFIKLTPTEVYVLQVKKNHKIFSHRNYEMDTHRGKVQSKFYLSLAKLSPSLSVSLFYSLFSIYYWYSLSFLCSWYLYFLYIPNIPYFSSLMILPCFSKILIFHIFRYSLYSLISPIFLIFPIFYTFLMFHIFPILLLSPMFPILPMFHIFPILCYSLFSQSYFPYILDIPYFCYIPVIPYFPFIPDIP